MSAPYTGSGLVMHKYDINMQGGDLSYTDMGNILVIVVAEIMLWEIMKQVISRVVKCSRSLCRLFLKTTNKNASRPTSAYGLDSSATQFGSSVWIAPTSGQRFHTMGSCSRLSISRTVKEYKACSNCAKKQG